MVDDKARKWPRGSICLSDNLSAIELFCVLSALAKNSNRLIRISIAVDATLDAPGAQSKSCCSEE
jgi:hypothetical protein